MIKFITATDFGPIQGSHFTQVYPITLVVGPNGSGKSHTLQAAYKTARAITGEEPLHLVEESQIGFASSIDTDDACLIHFDSQLGWRFAPNKATKPGEWQSEVPTGLPQAILKDAQSMDFISEDRRPLGRFQAPNVREIVEEWIKRADPRLDLNFHGNRALEVLAPLTGKDRIILIEQADAKLDGHNSAHLADAFMAAVMNGNQVIAEVANPSPIVQRLGELIRERLIPRASIGAIFVGESEFSTGFNGPTYQLYSTNEIDLPMRMISNYILEDD